MSDSDLYYWHGRMTTDRYLPEGGPPDELAESLERHYCEDHGGEFYRRTDRRPADERPIICHGCWMARESDGYRVTAEALLEAAGADPRVDDCEIEHTGGGCHSVGIRFHGQPEGLAISAGDAENGPLCMGDPPTYWSASLYYYRADDDGTTEEYECLANVDTADSPAELLDALVPLIERAATAEGRAAMDAEATAAWQVEHEAYLERDALTRMREAQEGMAES